MIIDTDQIKTIVEAEHISEKFILKCRLCSTIHRSDNEDDLCLLCHGETFTTAVTVAGHSIWFKG